MKFKNESGITLVALVITIVILLILAGISLIGILGEKGIYLKAKQAKENSLKAQEQEKKVLESYEKALDNTRDNIQSFNSNIIEKIQITSKQNDSYIEINIDITKKQDYSKIVYILYRNKKMYNSYKIDEIVDNKIKIEDIEPSTEYSFYLLVIDEDGGIVKSNETTIKTLDKVYTWKLTEYPVLTKTGINNMKKVDQYGNIVEYKKDLTQGDCIASDALPIAAWDDNTSTSVRTGTYYIEISNEMINSIFVWNQYWQGGCTSRFSFCNENKGDISYWDSDISGERTIINNTKYIKYYSNGHYLYEVSGR